jgi:(p)ppGpp synthase/HD superfamily hydrolase
MPATKAPDLACALAFALASHDGQVRKGTSVPYVSHLLQVAGMVLEHGGDTEQAIAGLLHDAVEDCDEVTFDIVREQFGARVASIVAHCTDTFEGDSAEHKSPWKERKVGFIRGLAGAPDDAVLVSACDKVHNLGSIVADVRETGIGYLDRFSAKPAQQLWYFRTVLGTIGDRIPPKLRDRFEELLAELESLLGEE